MKNFDATSVQANRLYTILIDNLFPDNLTA
jgi:hypothetical protein